ncbi:hypothetical protein SAMN05660420_03379 [Desulfuromusa kysingii]|uniref:Uncharacterized protein n=1 Tax=Desulfuromusa kysingii TaxID=37625 RepID=A0A1H4EHB8_9BACT|nr:hypothetical protein [Desulfuromusa kysingii]SEA84326.1 hypothetical protein SAMN05660420_03379 [Desulfuromusa kysingii]
MIVRWKTIKEHRGDYFVEYHPACSSMYLAILTIVYTIPISEKSVVVKIIEKEFKLWIQQFPIPLMASARDASDSLICLRPIHSEHFLSGFIDEGIIQSSWNLKGDTWFPKYQKEDHYRKQIYSDLDSITREDIDLKIDHQRKIAKTGWVIVFVWAVIIPSLIALLGFFNLFFVGVIALTYSLFRAVKKALEMLGALKKTKAQKEKEKEELSKEHHHYHCKLNPNGFLQLRTENLEKEIREKIQKESQEIKNSEQINESDS